MQRKISMTTKDKLNASQRIINLLITLMVLLMIHIASWRHLIATVADIL